MTEHRVIVVGGGLAGLTVAWELTKVLPGREIALYEKLDRLGGKAGSNRVDEQTEHHEAGTGRPVAMSDHGYHLFPAWYKNVIHLMSEVGQDYEREIVTGESFGRAVRQPTALDTLDEATRGKHVVSARHDPSDGTRASNRWRKQPLPVDEHTMYLRRTPKRHLPLFALTAAHLATRSEEQLKPLSVQSFLDAYHPWIAEAARPLYRTMFLKAFSAREEDMSALSVALFFRYWVSSLCNLLTATWSSLGGSLQRVLVNPIGAALESRGVTVECNTRLVSAEFDKDSATCTRLTIESNDGATTTDTRDSIVVFALPPGDLRAAIDDEWPIWESLGRLAEMTTQFAGVDVHFSAPVNLPRNHFGFDPDGELGDIAATAYNVAPIWPATELAEPREVVLQVVVPETAPAATESDVETRVRQILATVGVTNVERVIVNLNHDSRLSLANVCSHEYAAQLLTLSPRNVLVAGDYMPSGISVPSMEAAVGSGFRIAQSVYEKLPPTATMPGGGARLAKDPDPPLSIPIRVLGALGRLCSYVERAFSPRTAKPRKTDCTAEQSQVG